MFHYVCTTCMASGTEPFEVDTCLHCGGHLDPIPNVGHATRRKAELLGAAFERGRQTVTPVVPTSPARQTETNPAARSPTSLTYAEAAQRLGCGMKTVRWLVAQGNLKKAPGSGRKARVSLVSVEAFETPRPPPARKPPTVPRPAATPVTPGAVTELFGRPSRKSNQPAT